MDRVNGGMKRSSSENATNATRDPETMFSQGPGAGQGCWVAIYHRILA